MKLSLAEQRQPCLNLVILGASYDDDEEDKLSEAAALPVKSATSIDYVADDDIDENLFDGDDLDVVDEQLDTLELVD